MKTTIRFFLACITGAVMIWWLSGLPLAHAGTRVMLEQPVHFLAPDGSDLVIKPGTYSVEPAEEWIRLMAGQERHDAQLIEARASSHTLELEHTLAMSLPGESEEEADLHHILVLLPGGKSLEATGTYSGIRPRGFFRVLLTPKLENWARLGLAASDAAREEARIWLRQIYVDERKCKVKATVLIGDPGVLKSRHSFEGRIAKALKTAGASQFIAEGWDRAFKESWEHWATNSRLMVPGAYPGFDVVPGPKALPARNVPFPLGEGAAIASVGMSPHKINQKVLANLGTKAKLRDVKSAVNAFATDLGSRLAVCLSSCMLEKVMGSGPVPTYAPPFRLVGPVDGTCKGGLIRYPRGF